MRYCVHEHEKNIARIEVVVTTEILSDWQECGISQPFFMIYFVLTFEFFFFFFSSLAHACTAIQSNRS